MAISWSSSSRRQLPTYRSATLFCQGQPTAVRTVAMFIGRIAPGTSVPYLASWSTMSNLMAGSWGKASLNFGTNLLR
jgi:hypothetical protein